MQYPMHNDRWSGYFEDVVKDTKNVNQALPTMTAFYILSQPNPVVIDEHWTGDCGRLLDWVRHKLAAVGPISALWAIDEQGSPPEYSGCCSRAGLASDTSRWARHQCDVLRAHRRFAGPRRRLPRSTTRRILPTTMGGSCAAGWTMPNRIGSTMATATMYGIIFGQWGPCPSSTHRRESSVAIDIRRNTRRLRIG